MNLKSSTRCFSVSCTGDSSIIKSASNYVATLLPPATAAIISPTPENNAVPDPVPPVQSPVPTSQPEENPPAQDNITQTITDISPSATLTVAASNVPQSPKPQAIIAPIRGPTQSTLPGDTSGSSSGTSGAAIGGAIAGIIVLLAALGIVYVRYNRATSEPQPTDIEVPTQSYVSKSPTKRKALPIPKTERTVDGKFTAPPSNVLNTTASGVTSQSIPLQMLPTGVTIQKPAAARQAHSPMITDLSKDGYFVVPAGTEFVASPDASRPRQPSPGRQQRSQRSPHSPVAKEVQRN
ncbi:hypothetical protein HDU79_005299 [Rhizoclosmatium sp. JEL0117]|nr:hypothetical protein HDU79_005299 [Rhizoclosmatium sp. JEL0117]